jgi:hypothetical protein
METNLNRKLICQQHENAKLTGQRHYYLHKLLRNESNLNIEQSPVSRRSAFSAAGRDLSKIL